MPSPADSLRQQDFIRLSGPPDGDWGQRPGGGPISRGRRSGPGHTAPYLPRRPAADWERPPACGDRRSGDGRRTMPLVRPEEPAPPAGCPWMRPGKKYSRGVIGLHEEIEDFFQYMSPTVDEHHMRSCVFGKIRDVILRLWPEAQVFIFGSFETGLYLPTSDIDVVAIGKWRGSPLEMLKGALIVADVCDYDAIKVLDKAAVPIVKLTERRSQIKVDISFNMNNGLISANRIKQLIAEFPHLPRLVMILKQFLLQRELNEVFTGGVSSYGVILMVVSFLQTHERHLGVFPGCNLGVLLMEFFELYGIKFNYHNTCIRVREKGYAPRSEVESQFTSNNVHNSPLCIEDPHNPSNDIGRSSYHLLKVKEAFRYAYHKLRFSVLAPGKDGDPNRNSILGRIITVSDETEDFRRWVRLSFPSPEPPGTEPDSWPPEEGLKEEGKGEEEKRAGKKKEKPGAGDSPESESDGDSPTPPPPPESPQRTGPGRKKWWTAACKVALREESKARNRHKKLASQDSLIAFRKASSRARRVMREAKEAAGILCNTGKKHGPGDSPESESGSDSPTPAPSPEPTQKTGSMKTQKTWWTVACQVALQEKNKAKNRHKKRASQDSLIAFRKARFHARNVFREAKEAAGILCDTGKKHGPGDSPESESGGDSPTPVPSPEPTQKTRSMKTQKTWWTVACQVALQERNKAKNSHRKRASQDSLLALKKASSNARRVIREAKEAAGVLCDRKKTAEEGKMPDEKTDAPST